MRAVRAVVPVSIVAHLTSWSCSRWRSDQSQTLRSALSGEEAYAASGDVRSEGVEEKGVRAAMTTVPRHTAASRWADMLLQILCISSMFSLVDQKSLSISEKRISHARLPLAESREYTRGEPLLRLRGGVKLPEFEASTLPYFVEQEEIDAIEALRQSVCCPTERSIKPWVHAMLQTFVALRKVARGAHTRD